jgi:hypothetical protein
MIVPIESPLDLLSLRPQEAQEQQEKPAAAVTARARSRSDTPASFERMLPFNPELPAGRAEVLWN